MGKLNRRKELIRVNIMSVMILGIMGVSPFMIMIMSLDGIMMEKVFGNTRVRV